jgi:hypothetical protein
MPSLSIQDLLTVSLSIEDLLAVSLSMRDLLAAILCIQLTIRYLCVFIHLPSVAKTEQIRR